MRSQNIVLFSSGVSEREGISLAIRDALEAMGYSCSYWRELFCDAKDSRNISLLPMLVKKIPTFDFAVLICEGHDRTMVQRGEICEMVPTMRDNVLFEIGLCVMALGLPRVILVTDGQVRLPEDLMGPNNGLAVKQVCYCAADAASVQQAAANTARYIAGVPDACGQIQAYIEQNKACYSPVVVGAAANTACGYASNFVVRLLNGLDETVTLEGTDRWNGERARCAAPVAAEADGPGRRGAAQGTHHRGGLPPAGIFLPDGRGNADHLRLSHLAGHQLQNRPHDPANGSGRHRRPAGRAALSGQGAGPV